MGFYGNITNVANTTFQFDKIYPNRVDMTARCNNDGIMVGRYILVEYDLDAAYPVIYTNNGKFYSSPEFEEITRIKFLTNTNETTDGFHLNEIGQIQTDITVDFYQCTGADEDYAVFTKIEKPNVSNYIANFSIDEARYSTGKSFKGYDSTVWVKTSKENNGVISTHYVNIADLNSVVPTFDIAADAPTMEPLTPHFDANSTNVYYKLHAQAPFGFRVKAVENNEASDEKTTHYTTVYDEKTNVTTTEVKENVNADIFYNKDALTFKKNDTSNRIVEEPPSGANEIKILPSGKSADFANKYAHYSKGENVGDIQELSIHLPSVGYMVSKGWDIIHGPNRDDARTDENSSLQGRLDSIKDLERNQIPIKRKSDGTIIGTTINGGQQSEVNSILDEQISSSFKSDDAWIKTKIDSSDDQGEKCIYIHHDFHSVDNIITKSDKNTDNNDFQQNTGENAGKGDNINLHSYTIDQAGHVVGTNTETVTLPYGYKTITIGEPSSETSDLTPSAGIVIAKSTQDNINLNAGNSWIEMLPINDDTITIGHAVSTIFTNPKADYDFNDKEANDYILLQDISCDSAGHITANQTHKYTLPFGFKYVELINNTSNTDVFDKVENMIVANNITDTLKINSANKWIKLDSTTGELKISHNIIGEDFGKNYSFNNSTTPEFGDDIALLKTIDIDNAGHTIALETETIQIPKGSLEVTTRQLGDEDVFSSPETSLITQLKFEPNTGKISIVKADSNTFGVQCMVSGQTLIGDEYIQGLGFGNPTPLSDVINDICLYVNETLTTEPLETDYVITNVYQQCGKIMPISSRLGDIKLSDYTKPTSLEETADIQKSDSLKIALGKLEYRLDQATIYTDNKIKEITGDASASFNSLQKIEEYIKELPTADTLSSEVAAQINALNLSSTYVDRISYEGQWAALEMRIKALEEANN